MKKITITLLILMLMSFTQILKANCNWKNKITNAWALDSCWNNNASLHAGITLNSTTCTRYEVYVDNVLKVTKNSSYFNNSATYYQQVYSNGTYSVCFKLYDSCNKCDTTICKNVTVSCFSSSSSCNWKNKISNFWAIDSCWNNNASLHAGFTLSSKSCIKYDVYVDSAFKVSKSGSFYSNSASYYQQVYNNGTYTVCFKLYDSCNKCDTTICKNITVSCFTSGSGCNWKNKITSFWATDSCWNNNASLHAGFTLNSTSCIRYDVYVDSALKVSNSSAFYSNWASFYQQVNKNGTYSVCFKLYDSCKNCDTTICRNITVNCSALKSVLPKINRVKAFPNPTTGRVRLTLNSAENTLITVNSLQGQQLLQIKPISKDQWIDLSAFTNGTYLINITNSIETKTVIVIKKN